MKQNITANVKKTKSGYVLRFYSVQRKDISNAELFQIVYINKSSSTCSHYYIKGQFGKIYNNHKDYIVEFDLNNRTVVVIASPDYKDQRAYIFRQRINKLEIE